MANRRMIGQALQNSSEMLKVYLSHILQLERQKQGDAAAAAQAQQSQDAQFDLSIIPKVASGDFNPAAFTPPQRARIGGKVNLDTLFPSDQQRGGKGIGESVGKADTLSKLPTDPELLSMLRGVGINTDDQYGSMDPSLGEGPTKETPQVVTQALE